MPRIADIVTLTELLKDAPVYVAQERCVAVRNRNSKCRLCQSACKSDAVKIGVNKLEIDFSLCVACGACTAVCPTEALISLSPFDTDLTEGLKASIAQNEGRAYIACARQAAQCMVDPNRFVQVSCLCRIEESVIVEAFAGGASALVLVDAECKTCKYRAHAASVEEALESATAVLDALGLRATLKRASEFPPSMQANNYHDFLRSSRRDFFFGSGKTVQDVAAKSAKAFLNQSESSAARTLREMLKLDCEGRLPSFKVAKRARLLDAMDALALQKDAELSSRLFSVVTIDEKRCFGCEMCTVFCPTKALRKSDEKPDDGKGAYLEFSAADCVSCGLCKDICSRKALGLRHKVSLSDIFNFEPQKIFIPEKPKRRGFAL